MQQDTRRYIAVALVLLVGTGLTQLSRSLRQAEAHYEADFSRVPLVIGEYEGEARPVDESIFAYLQANAMEERIYVGEDRAIRLALIYGTDWRSIHAPTGCFDAQGWHIVHNRAVEISVPGAPVGQPVHARVLDVNKDDVRLLAMFVYAQPGGTTSDWTVHGWRVATGPRGAGGMIIILQTEVRAGDVRAAEKDMFEMMSIVYPQAVSLWQGHSTDTTAREHSPVPGGQPHPSEG